MYGTTNEEKYDTQGQKDKDRRRRQRHSGTTRQGQKEKTETETTAHQAVKIFTSFLSRTGSCSVLDENKLQFEWRPVGPQRERSRGFCSLLEANS